MDILSKTNKTDLGQKQIACPRHGGYESCGVKYSFLKHEVWSTCPVCDTEKAQAERNAKQQKENGDKEKRLQEILGRTSLPKRFIGKTFKTYQAQEAMQQQALEIAMDYAKNMEKHVKDGTGLIFTGQPGTGKSHLAGAILQEIIPEYVGVYVTLKEMIRSIRDAWHRSSELTPSQVINRYIHAHLLVLDEVGVQYGTQGEQTELFDVLDGRYRQMMPTIILSNLPATVSEEEKGKHPKLKSIKDYIGERLFDRLRETSRVCTFEWPSYRGEAAKAYWV